MRAYASLLRLCALFLCGALALAACGKPQETPALMAAPPASDGPVANLPQGESGTPGEDVSVGLSVLSRGLTAAFAGNEAGCYRVLTHIDGTADIHYIDYAAKTLQKLQGMPQHSSLQMGQLYGCRSGASPVVFGGALYLFQSGGGVGLNDANGDAVSAIITRIDGDPAQPSQVLFPARWSFQPDSAILSDGSSLYFLMQDTATEELGTVLMALNGESLEYREVQRLPAGLEYTIEGTWDKGPVLCGATPLPPVNDPGFNTAWSARSFSLFALGMNSGEQQPLFNWGQGFSYTMQGNTLYYWAEEEQAVYTLNADTGDHALLANGFLPEDHEHVLIQSGLLDGMLRVQVSTKGLATGYVINPATGEVSQPPVEELGDGIIIYAETSTAFLVRSGEKWVNRELAEPDFDPTAPGLSYNDLWVKAPVFSLLYKSDYWAGNPTFDEIQDLVYVK